MHAHFDIVALVYGTRSPIIVNLYPYTEPCVSLPSYYNASSLGGGLQEGPKLYLCHNELRLLLVQSYIYGRLYPGDASWRPSCEHRYDLFAAAALSAPFSSTTMSDPPPKKVGSLRDRIAAFENKGSAPAPAPPPAPRPKPGHINWTPKPLSPPTSPKASSSGHDDSAEARKAAGMSATDAKESIGKLSLKERMAALQGSGGFSGPGGAAAAPPPRPSGEKPKWKPPPVVQRVEPIGGDDEEDKPTEVKAEREHTDEPKSPEEAAETKESEQEPREEGEPDPQEEERQRRAALAARMARLGGARVGMGPPIFGKKPDVPPKKVHKEEGQPKEEEQPKEKLAEASPTAEGSDGEHDRTRYARNIH